METFTLLRNRAAKISDTIAAMNRKMTGYKALALLTLLLLCGSMTAQAADETGPTVSDKTVTVTGNDTGSFIIISWKKATDNVTAQSNIIYNVFWKLPSEKYWNLKSGKDMTSCLISPLKPETEYKIQVTAKDEAGRITNYTIITVKTVADSEGPVINDKTITATDVTATSAVISWKKATDEVSGQSKLRYRVQWGLASSTESTLDDMLTDESSFTITGMAPGKEYKIRVLTFDEANNSSYYDFINVTTKTEAEADETAPTVADKSISVKATSGSYINISWNKATDNVTAQSKLIYSVYWKLPADKGWNMRTITDANFYSITGLTPETEYDIMLDVEDERGNYTRYTQISASTTADIDSPTIADVHITVTDITTTTATVSWNKAEDDVTAEGNLRYRVKWGLTSSDSSILDDMLTDETSFTITGMAPNSEYRITVLVFDEAGNDKEYDKNIITTKTDADIDKPTLSDNTITVTDVTDHSISVSWVKATDNKTAQSDLIYWVTLTGDGTSFSQEVKDGTSCTIDQLAANTEYEITIQVFDTSGNFEKYAPATATTDPLAVTSIFIYPTSLELYNEQTKQLIVVYTPTLATDQTCTWSSSDEAIATVSATGLVTAISKGIATITATSNDGGITSTCPVTVLGAVGNETIEGSHIWTSRGMLHLSLATPETVSVYAATGAMAKQIDAPSGSTTLPLASGIYIVRIGDRSMKVMIK